jgi:hypothetical protein
MMEECTNCGRIIGKLETPRVFDGNVVCAGCWGVLTDTTAKSVLGYESTADTKRRIEVIGGVSPQDLSKRCCPVCGSTDRPVKKRKGSFLVMLFLLCLWIIPGILYAIFWNGYVMACPNCGAKLADAT